MNDVPAFAGLDDTPAFTEGGAAVVLDDDATVSDVELDAANNYTGAVLTLQRQGGANPNDVFATTGTLSFSGTDVLIGAAVVGTLTTHAAAPRDHVQRQRHQRAGGPGAAAAHLPERRRGPARLGGHRLYARRRERGRAGVGRRRNGAGTITVGIAAVNDGPVNTVPLVAQSVNEDVNLVFSAGNGNPISIADADVAGDTLRVTLGVAAGVLTLGSIPAGLSFSTGDGTQDATMTFSGTLADINTALSGLTYRGNLNVSGPDTLTITTNDEGNNGTDPGTSGDGTSEEDVDTVAITVNAVNDAPVFAGLDNAPTFTEGGAPVVLDGNATVSDVELDALNGGLGNYAGAVLTLQRQGGGSLDDLFFTTGTLSFSFPNVLIGGTVVGTLTSNRACSRSRSTATPPARWWTRCCSRSAT